VSSLTWVDGRIAITYMHNLVTSSVYVTTKEELLSGTEEVHEDAV
jgi:hypothetical protein